MIRRLALAAGLALGLAAPAAAQQAGLYDVSGTNLDGTPYTGLARLEHVGLASFRIAWRIGGQVVEGVGMASGRTVTVAYGLRDRPGLGVYTLNPDGSMEGEWTIVGANARGTERLVPRPAGETAPPGAPAPSPGAGAPAPSR